MTDALKKLIDAVEAGDEYFIRSDDWIFAWQQVHPEPDEVVSQGKSVRSLSWYAYDGSLDAARDLHDILLHESAWASISYSKRYEGEARAEVTLSDGTWQATADNPARAWLLAILKAKLAETDMPLPSDRKADG